MLNDRKSLTPLLIARATSISLLGMISITAGPAAATPKFAEWTAQACNSCHSNPATLKDMLGTAGAQPVAATPKVTRQACDTCHPTRAILTEFGRNFARTLPLWER